MSTADTAPREDNPDLPSARGVYGQAPSRRQLIFDLASVYRGQRAEKPLPMSCGTSRIYYAQRHQYEEELLAFIRKNGLPSACHESWVADAMRPRAWLEKHRAGAIALVEGQAVIGPDGSTVRLVRGSMSITNASGIAHKLYAAESGSYVVWGKPGSGLLFVKRQIGLSLFETIDLDSGATLTQEDQ